jgi:outer membrane receptor protein involved in Fe transport
VTTRTPYGPWIDEVLATRDTTITDRTIEHNSFYLELIWDITDKLTFTAEGRYVDEDNTITGPDPIENPALQEAPGTGPGTRTLCGSNGPCTPRPPGGGNGSGIPNGARGFGAVRPVQYITFERNDDYVTPRFALDWKARENLLLYGSYSVGKKPGGFSTITIGAFGLQSRSDIEFEPEQLKEYELGWKSSWLNRRLIVNGALFFEDFTDKQISTQAIIGNTLGNVIRNIGGAEVTGLELSTQWRATNKLTLALNYTYLDSEFTDFNISSSGAAEIARVGNCTPVPVVTVVPTAVTQVVAGMAVTSTVQQTQVTTTCNVSRTGNKLEDTPENAFAAQVSWRDQMANGWEWSADFSTRYQGKRFLEDDNSVWVDSYMITDASLGFSNEKWNILLYADNLFDDDTIRSGGSGPGNPVADFRFGQVLRAGPPIGTPPIVGGTIAAPFIPTLIFANLPDPRTVGLRVSYKF